jgi:AbiV family abortive infection protein
MLAALKKRRPAGSADWTYSEHKTNERRGSQLHTSHPTMLCMATIAEIEPILNACLLNAERLLNSAKSVMAPGQYHVAYHLAALAMEEIGKAGLIFIESMDLRSDLEDEESRLSRWMEDHERKLFWALWLPTVGIEADWRTIPKHLELAKGIHETRLQALYFDPAYPNAQDEITEERAERLVGLTESRLEMERVKRYRELDEKERSDMQWFSFATRNPEMKPSIFSKQSMAKQIELQDDRTGWIRWLRELFEGQARKAMEQAQIEMQRQRPDGEERFADKWKLRIRLKSWSHSIRPNQLTGWNKGVDKIKLIHTTDRNDLIVEFLIGKNVLMGDLWGFGMNSCVMFLCALNISTGGFFWWYLPVFTSRFYDTITDLESEHHVIVERVPELRISWGHMVLKEDDLLRQMPMVYSYIVQAGEDEQKFYRHYFGMLGMMAKNDLFFQFEHNLVVGFMECFEMALITYKDWDGTPETYNDAVAAVFSRLAESAEFMAMLKECAHAAVQVKTQSYTRPITLDDVAKSKFIFDIYIRVKAAACIQERAANEASKSKPAAPTSEAPEAE